MADSNAFAFLQMDPANRSERLWLRDCKVYMSPFEHDMAHVIVQGPDDADWTQWDTGTPLWIQYGRNPSSVATFYGYLLSTTRHWDQTQKLAVKDRLMEVIAIGASWPLKDGLSTSYTNLTSSQMAQQIATINYFNVDAPATSYVWPSKNVGGCSEWEFLCDLAKQSGLICYMHGTELRFYDAMTRLRRNNSVVPVFYEKDSGKGMSVLSFSTDSTDMSADPGRIKRNRVHVSTDIRTGQPVLVQDDGTTSLGSFLAARYKPPAFTEYATDLVSESQMAAQTLLPARTIENRFAFRAKGVLSGDARVTQESPIVVEGVGARNSGIWQVLEVCHHVKWHWYSTDVTLGRDSDYDNGVRPGLPANQARAQFDPSQTIVFNDPPTTLVNGRWRSAWTSGQVLGAA